MIIKAQTVKLSAAVFACFLLGACYSPPFRKPELKPVSGVKPHEVSKRYSAKLAPSFETENTVIFRFFRNEIPALGYARVNRTTESYEIVCLSHTGAQLFHISGDKDGNNHLVHAMPEFREYPGFADAVGNDIRRIYFDLVPDPSAEPEMRRNKIRFRQPKKDKTIEYVFGGRENMLLKKRARSDFRILWEVSFFEYFDAPDDVPEYSFPGGVVLHNREHRYRLIIKTRNVDL